MDKIDLISSNLQRVFLFLYDCHFTLIFIFIFILLFLAVYKYYTSRGKSCISSTIQRYSYKIIIINDETSKWLERGNM